MGEKRRRIVWTPEERESVFNEAERIQSESGPRLSAAKLLREAQKILPEDRHRPMAFTGSNVFPEFFKRFSRAKAQPKIAKPKAEQTQPVTVVATKEEPKQTLEMRELSDSQLWTELGNRIRAHGRGSSTTLLNEMKDLKEGVRRILVEQLKLRELFENVLNHLDPGLLLFKKDEPKQEAPKPVVEKIEEPLKHLPKIAIVGFRGDQAHQIRQRVEHVVDVRDFPADLALKGQFFGYDKVISSKHIGHAITDHIKEQVGKERLTTLHATSVTGTVGYILQHYGEK